MNGKQRKGTSLGCEIIIHPSGWIFWYICCMCDKIPYETEKQAKKYAEGQRRKYNQKMSSYFCRSCNKFHLTKSK